MKIPTGKKLYRIILLFTWAVTFIGCIWIENIFLKSGMLRSTFTGFVVLWLFISSFLLSILEVMEKLFRWRAEITVKIRLPALSILFALLLGEILLRFIPGTKSYIELRNGYYQSPLKSFAVNWFWLHMPNQSYYLISDEFKYPRQANGLGLSDTATLTTPKPAGEYRILFLGDSFTEGDGAPYDSSYVRALANMLNAPGRMENIVCINAGVCGSDPLFNYVHLQNLLIKTYQPDLVVQTHSSQDMLDDIRIRGGFERFKPEGKVEFTNHFYTEGLYACSFLYRLLVQAAGYNKLFVMKEIDAKELARMENVNTELLAKYDSLASANNFKVLMVMRPGKYEIIYDTVKFDFKHFEQQVKASKNIRYADLLRYDKDIEQVSDSTVIHCFWVRDGHHNSQGYGLMARGVKYYLDRDSLLPLGIAEKR